MNKDTCFYLGSILKAKGLKGELVAHFDVDNLEKYTGLDMVLVDSGNGLLPYFVEKISVQNGKAVLKFEELDSLEQCSPLVGAGLYLPENLLEQVKEVNFYFHELIGYRVVDKALGHVGSVSSYFDQTAQIMLGLTTTDGTERLLPLVDDLVSEIDHEAKTLHTQLPEGLLEL